MEINKNNYEAWFLDYFEGNLNESQKADLFLFLEQHPELREDFDSFELISLDSFPESFDNKSGLKKPALHITPENREELFIAFHEGLLSASERNEILAFVHQHPDFLNEFNLYAQTVLQPEATTFVEKSFLKQEVSIAEINEVNREYALIASVENELSLAEQKVVSDFASQNKIFAEELKLLKKTVLLPDYSITYKNKEGLKRGKIIAFPWIKTLSYAAAASLVFGLFFLFGPGNETTVAENAKPVKEKNTTILPEENNGVENIAFTPEETPQPENKSAFERSIHKEIKQQPELPNDLVKQEEKKDTVIQKQLQKFNPDLNNDVKQNIALQKDSAANSSVNEDMALVFPANEDHFMNPKEFLVKKTNEVITGDENKDASSQDVANVVSNGLTKITGTPVTIAAEKSDEFREYGLAFGGFQFSRKVKR